MVLVQKWQVFQLFFLGNIGQENVFHYTLERKNGFLGYKNKKFNQSNNWHFSKGVNPWFKSKNGHFSTFFYAYRPGKCLYDILERENAFLGYNNKKFKQSKNCHFSKRVNPWFLSKDGNFSKFFFFVFYDILEQKKTPF